MGKQTSDFDKGRIISYLEAGKSGRYIARKLGRGHAAIAVFIKKFKATRVVHRKKGSGRPRVTTKREDRAIVRTMLPNRRVSTRKIIQDLGLHVSMRTVRRRMNAKGYHGVFERKKNYVSDRNRIKRVRWARAHKDWTYQDWKKVLWSDESPYTFRYQGKCRVWARKGERLKPQCMKGTVKHGGKINVWGCFSAEGVGHLTKVRGILEQKQMKQILIHHLIPSAQALFGRNAWMFQQDNDPKHTARSVQRWMHHTRHLDVLPWPAQSPDLNPIENLWAIVDQRLKHRQCNSQQELFDTIKRRWDQIPLQTLENLVKSMPKRCKDVIKSRGYPINY